MLSYCYWRFLFCPCHPHKLWHALIPKIVFAVLTSLPIPLPWVFRVATLTGGGRVGGRRQEGQEGQVQALMTCFPRWLAGWRCCCRRRMSFVFRSVAMRCDASRERGDMAAGHPARLPSPLRPEFSALRVRGSFFEGGADFSTVRSVRTGGLAV